ncbi:putative F-box protein At5g55150 [Tripterygium wilfordii]|uniref:putative F-box protein At5g55150 n=1 Tax=Tripterygium wilfordii TaxID=458696 RepID=UPI0018F83105|nr:putative F-box protein At5g55150 [Tripterygium wilfordii]
MSTASSSWSTLIEELLESIFNCLEDSRDVFRCGLVCVSWRAVALKSYSKLIPCVLSSQRDEKTHTLFNIQTMETQKIQIPDYFPDIHCSTNYGWLIQFTEAGVDFNSDDDLPHKIHMLNLFSKAKVILPPTRNQIDKAATSTCPLNPECLVLVAYLCKYDYKLAFCKVGDENWTTLDRSYFVTEPQDCFLSVTWYKGKFYGVDADKRLFVCNLSSKMIELFCEEPFVIGFRFCETYLVESLFGELLLVFYYQRRQDIFKMYEFDFIAKKWYEVKNLRNQALFLSRDGSALSYIGNSKMVKRSCIIHFASRSYSFQCKYRHDLVVYDMETESFEFIPESTTIGFTEFYTHLIAPDLCH